MAVIAKNNFMEDWPMQEAYVLTDFHNHRAVHFYPSMVAHALLVPSSLMANVQCIQRMLKWIPRIFAGQGIGRRKAPAV